MKQSATILLGAPLILASFASAITVDCEHIRADGKKFNFQKLKGPHSVSYIDEHRTSSVFNTTWTVDICGPMQRRKENLDDQCPSGTWVCGIETSYDPKNDPKKEHVLVTQVIPVAGNYHTSDGGSLDPQYERLKSTDSNAEGLEVQLSGGTYDKRKQRAVIQFQCDKNRSGNEGNEQSVSKLKRRDDDDDKNDDKENSLSFVSYGAVEGKEAVDVLRLDWKTKYACEDYEEDDDDDKKKSSWGFFTWMILLLFLGISAYLIFGSWLNYNRYGARGWDLLPHGDTIRDIPYLVKDWSRKVVDTVSGSGTRGGYSAV